MKIPQDPPDFYKLLRELSASGIDMGKLLTVSLDEERYFSYEDIKYRPIPEPIREICDSREAWWVRVKMDRMLKYRALPFTDANKEPFRFFIDNADLQLIHNMDFNGGGTLGTSDCMPDEKERNKYFISSLIEEAFFSSAMEGAVSTRAVAKKMIAENREPRDKSERMILNNYKTMQLLEAWKDEPLSSELICRIHARISEDTLPNEKLGTYRTEKDIDIALADDEGNIYHTPCDYREIEAKIAELCSFANSDESGRNFIHPIVKAVILHFMLAYIHPFCDGNGRTSRTLFYWYLIKNNYWVSKFISISKVLLESGNRYYLSFLNTEHDYNDLNYFIKFQLEALDRAIKAFNDFVSDRRAEMKDALKHMEILNSLNERQKSIALKIIRSPYVNAEFTIESHKGLNDISWETSRHDLLDLERRKILCKRKSGRAFVFTPSKEFLGQLSTKP